LIFTWRDNEVGHLGHRKSVLKHGLSAVYEFFIREFVGREIPSPNRFLHLFGS